MTKALASAVEWLLPLSRMLWGEVLLKLLAFGFELCSGGLSGLAAQIK